MPISARRAVLAGIQVLLLVGCGAVEPVDEFVVSGLVLTQNREPVQDAVVTLWHTDPSDSSRVELDSVATDSFGAFELRTGPPPGHDVLDCTTLSLNAWKAGATLEWALGGACRASSFWGDGNAVGGIELILDP